MHKTLYFFPNFNQNDAIFPNSKGPGPIPKKGCESPEFNQTCKFNKISFGKAQRYFMVQSFLPYYKYLENYLIYENYSSFRN